MAAHSNNFIRLRLDFDYPPPAVIGCRMCWLLVDLNTCRVVADLESIIRDKFEFSRRSILNLFIEDCYLPHTESIYVVRDNDNVRVKVDCQAQVNGHDSYPDTASEKCRKRRRAPEEDGAVEKGLSVEWKKKKRKKRSVESVEGVEGVESVEVGAKRPSSDDRNKKLQENHKENKKKKTAVKNGPSATPKPAVSPKKIPPSVSQPSKSTKKLPAARAKTQNASSSDSSSSSSEEDDAPKKTATKIPTPTPAASKPPPNTKPAQTKSHPPSSSSSETSSSSDEATSVKITPKNKPVTPATNNSKSHQPPLVLQSTSCAQKVAASVVKPPLDKVVEPRKSDSEEEIQLVIRRPLQQPGHGLGSQFPWRGRGRGKARHGLDGPGEGGRSEGRGGYRGHSGSYNGAKEAFYQTDSLANISVVLQNEAESAPKQDYSSMPLLAAPPQVGQKIAFKLMELSESYTPEVSEYKEGKIVSVDPTTKQIELELLNAPQAPLEPGKFDLVYENQDGSMRVEYAVSRGSSVTERWESLLEPRLII